MEQLRFDILEKIRLHPQQAGISSLLELDLYPDVEIKDEGQHLKIQGYLRLNGTYEGDLVEEVEVADTGGDELENEEIAYVIPVEITLPRERAELAFVSAEVESFDYHLLSPFELQIEAVLMIDGILPEKENEEELITEISDQEEIAKEEIAKEEIAKEEIAKEEEEVPTFAAQPAKQEEGIAKDDPLQQEEERVIHRETRRTTHQQDVNEQQEESTTPVLVIDEEEQPTDIEVPSNIEEELRGKEWSRWLVGSKEDTFVSLKLVIVQRDESIDSLAAKYETSCEAILRTNQFTTDRLSEGQIVKIPVKRN